MFDGAFGDAPRRSSDDFLQELDQLLEGAVALEKIDDAHECGKQYNRANFLSDDIGARLSVFVQLWSWRPFPPHLPRVHPSPKMRCVQITLTLSNSDFSRSSLQMRQTSFSTRAAAALVTIIKIIEY